MCSMGVNIKRRSRYNQRARTCSRCGKLLNLAERTARIVVCDSCEVQMELDKRIGKPNFSGESNGIVR